jgi:hypothetical protein
VFVEIAPFERLIFDHISGHKFRVIATFREEGDATRLVWRMQFDSAEECARVRTFAGSKNEENLDRLYAELGGKA